MHLTQKKWAFKPEAYEDKKSYSFTINKLVGQ